MSIEPREMGRLTIHPSESSVCMCCWKPGCWVRHLQELGAMDEVHGDENQIRWGLEEVMVGLGRLQQ